jgi:hypothetical protein
VAAYGGVAMFGRSVRVAMNPNPSAEQINSFFGVSGTQSLYGGGRGRVFMVEGTLFGANASALSSAELLILSYADGIGRVFTDQYGRNWPMVVFRGEYSPQGRVMFDVRGYYQDYKAIFHGRL